MSSVAQRESYHEDLLAVIPSPGQTEVVSDVFSSLLRKMAILEKKNAELADENETLRENEKNLNSDFQVQQYIIDELKDEAKEKDAEIIRLKTNQKNLRDTLGIVKSMVDFTVKLIGK